MNCRAGMDGFWRRGNLLLLLGFEPQTVQAVASCYTDYTIPASKVLLFSTTLQVKLEYSRNLG